MSGSSSTTSRRAGVAAHWHHGFRATVARSPGSRPEPGCARSHARLPAGRSVARCAAAHRAVAAPGARPVRRRGAGPRSAPPASARRAGRAWPRGRVGEHPLQQRLRARRLAGVRDCPAPGPTGSPPAARRRLSPSRWTSAAKFGRGQGAHAVRIAPGPGPAGSERRRSHRRAVALGTRGSGGCGSGTSVGAAVAGAARPDATRQWRTASRPGRPPPARDSVYAWGSSIPEMAGRGVGLSPLPWPPWAATYSCTMDKPMPVPRTASCGWRSPR